METESEISGFENHRNYQIHFDAIPESKSILRVN